MSQRELSSRTKLTDAERPDLEQWASIDVDVVMAGVGRMLSQLEKSAHRIQENVSQILKPTPPTDPKN